ncbi:hypothetical protein CDFC105_73444 [Clostridioides difficile]|uniref:hypothetical protein n=1 Tax=Clostridioides sp. ZZV14-6150 TaxID=2811493 RepID=UPI0007BB4024|nr:hypothetical protein [Clostridioides sp. ZZV14-6150]CZR97678.1 hypothetical protein CDFC105_62471 [Clostridioides difficile]CZS10298.1 hypothetical protein CDFC105_73444 [Clostridioides difficile]
MYKVERYFSGSVVDNLIEDDLTCRNYLALYCCLLGIMRNGKKVYPRPEKMLSEFGVKKERKRKKSLSVRLSNVDTGEIKEFESLDSAACFLRLKHQAVYQTIKKQTKTRSGWRAEYIEEE